MVYPSYYKKFKCLGGTCRHNCCIGWEIDIDEDTYNYYKNVGGEMGERLEKSIAHGNVPHFILDKNERCPFLNGDNLCDIIINLGENHICKICTEHPRFINGLPERTEVGIGLTCEEAARIILSETEAFALVGAKETDDEIILLRDKVIAILQDGKRSFKRRIEGVLNEANAALPSRSLAEWRDVFASLERLDENWDKRLDLIKNDIDFDAFAHHMGSRMREYENLLIYFIYRYLANAPDFYEAATRAAFAVLCTGIIHAIGAAMYEAYGEFTFYDQIELCRAFSSEIEYSEDNVYALFDEVN